MTVGQEKHFLVDMLSAHCHYVFGLTSRQSLWHGTGPECDALQHIVRSCESHMWWKGVYLLSGIKKGMNFCHCWHIFTQGVQPPSSERRESIDVWQKNIKRILDRLPFCWGTLDVADQDGISVSNALLFVLASVFVASITGLPGQGHSNIPQLCLNEDVHLFLLMHQ